MRSEVQIFPGPPPLGVGPGDRPVGASALLVLQPQVRAIRIGAIAQLGERVLCKHEVVGSIPSGSTIYLVAACLVPTWSAPLCPVPHLGGAWTLFREEEYHFPLCVSAWVEYLTS